MSMDILKIRKDFKMLNHHFMQGHPLIYFDNAATSLKPQCVLDAIQDYYQNYTSNVHRGDYDLSVQADKAYESAREVVADFIHASAKEIVFTSGTTASLNLVAFGYGLTHLSENDEILLNEAEHASNILPWYEVAKKTKAIIKYIPLNQEGKVTKEAFLKTITAHTKIVSLAHISNVLGCQNEVKEIIEEAHQRNIIVVVDGAQSAPHLPINVKELDCDFFAFSGHKMYGPTGIGVLYGKFDLLDKLIPMNYGGGMNAMFTKDGYLELREIPTRLEGGTPNIEGVLGLSAAIDYLNNIGMDNINKYEKELRNYLLNELEKLDFITIYNKDVESNIVAFNIDGVFAQDTAIYLDKYNICVRAGNHCAKMIDNVFNISNTVRISLSFYNTKEEVDLLINVLKNSKNIWKEIL